MKKIIIESLVTSKQTAVMDDNKLEEFFVEEMFSKSIISNIYRGIVKKVVTGLDACFVDIGLENLAYLQLSPKDEIKSGDEVLVQVNKDEVGTKGAKLNLELSIAGRFLVYIPSNDRVTISNKIRSTRERERLKGLVDVANINGLGLIIRTEAEHCTLQDIELDIKDLKAKYEEIIKESKLGIGPKLLYKAESSYIKYINDNFNEDIEKIITDDIGIYEEIKSKLKSIDRDYIKKLVLEEDNNLFEIYGVVEKINKLFDRKVWLKSGGYLVVDKTEAMTVIDVNTGKFTKGSKLSEVILKTNKEAAVEVARQLKIRDISGIIIVDFIDMKSEKEKSELLKTLSDSLSLDNRKTEVFGMTRLGLVELARRRSKSSIDSYFLMDCPDCKKINSMKSIKYIMDKIEREVKRTKNHTAYNDVDIEINDMVFDQINRNYMNYIDEISKKYSIKIKLVENHKSGHENLNLVFNKNS